MPKGKKTSNRADIKLGNFGGPEQRFQEKGRGGPGPNAPRDGGAPPAGIY